MASSAAYNLSRRMQDAVQELETPSARSKFIPKPELRSSMLSDETLSDVLTELGIFSHDLLEFIVNDALCIFAILAVCEKITDIRTIYCMEPRVTDRFLPVAIHRGDQTISLISTSEDSRSMCSSSSGWNYNDCKSFSLNQWFFLALEFTDAKFAYTIPPEQPLPFLPAQPGRTINEGFFSTVRKEVMHHQYVHGERNWKALQSRDGPNPCVAVKVLKLGNDSGGYNRHDAESQVLMEIRKLEHPHLITAIAAYTRDNEKAFIFPWADGGSLLKVFKEHSNQLDRCPETMKWIIEQILGIFQGLSTLSEQNCRHGDLKPENILHFPDPKAEYQPGGTLTGRLVVADVGLTKFHEDSTADRRYPTVTWTGTQKYEPPEIEKERGHGIPRTRLYDVWSMGCVLLETLIWLVHGLNERDRFMKHLKQFWQQSNDGFDVQTWVRTWIRNLEENQRCSAQTAPGAILKLCRDKMLVVSILDRASMTKCMKEMEQIVEEIKKPGSSYLCDQALWNNGRSARVPPDPAQKSTDGFLTAISPGNNGLRPRRLSRNDGSVENDVSTLGILVSEFEEHDGQNSEYNDPFLHDLNDVWEINHDNDFARHFFSCVNASNSFPLNATRLCSACQDTSIWTMGFMRTETTRKLKDKAGKGCALCQMFLNCIDSRLLPDHAVVQFRRTGSSFQLSLGGPPCLSICVSPRESYHVSRETRIAWPELPPAGSTLQLDLIHYWLQFCNDNHQCVKPTGPIPTRVLQLDINDSAKLYSSAAGETGLYVALSHTWGSDDTGLLTLSNIAALQTGIKIQNLSKTFQHAIAITRSLGIHYLWIDSMCIIQDSADDWARESQMMGAVFSNAYFTIAASSSTDGFLRERPSRNYVHVSTENFGYYVCDMIDDFQRDVEQAPLSQRGWVLQERALSQRTIHFTPNQIYWECGEVIRSEAFSKLRNSKAAFLGDANFPQRSLKALKGGRIRLLEILYERYSQLAFTVKSDRAFGILGLESRLLQTFGSRGGYGITEIYLHRSLLWTRAGQRLAGRLGTVPTWSWMSIDGPISYLKVPPGSVLWDHGISSPFSGQSQSSKFGFMENSRIQRAMYIEADADEMDTEWATQWKPRITYDVINFPDSIGQLRFVRLGQRKSTGSPFKSQYYGLIVKLSDGEGLGRRDCIRVGVGELQAHHLLGLERRIRVRIT